MSYFYERNNVGLARSFRHTGLDDFIDGAQGRKSYEERVIERRKARLNRKWKKGHTASKKR